MKKWGKSYFNGRRMWVRCLKRLMGQGVKMKMNFHLTWRWSEGILTIFSTIWHIKNNIAIFAPSSKFMKSEPNNNKNTAPQRFPTGSLPSPRTNVALPQTFDPPASLKSLIPATNSSPARRYATSPVPLILLAFWSQALKVQSKFVKKFLLLIYSPAKPRNRRRWHPHSPERACWDLKCNVISSRKSKGKA